MRVVACVDGADGVDGVVVEVAVGLAGADVAVVSVGPGGGPESLRAGLALGARAAVLVADPLFTGGSSLAVAKAMAAAVRRFAPVDLVLLPAGTVVAAQVAELLGLPAVTSARRVEVVGGEVVAERLAEHGHEDVVCALPCVVSVTAGAAAGVTRYPSYRAIVAAHGQLVEVLDLAALGVVPPSGGGLDVVEVRAEPPRRPATELVVDDGRAHERILDLLVRLRLA